MSWIRSAYAAVGCALPLSHPRVQRARRCGLRVAILIPNVVDPQCVRSCGLRIAFVASACPRTSLPRSVYAAVGCALPSMHPNAQEFRRIRTPNKFCSARAAVGRALLSSHRCTEPRSCLAARTPLRAVCCFRRIRHPLASGASSWLRGSRWRVFGQSSNSDVTLQSYYYQGRASCCWRNPPCRWTQPCQVVEFNYQFMWKVCYIFNMNWEWSSGTAADAGWHIRP